MTEEAQQQLDHNASDVHTMAEDNNWPKKKWIGSNRNGFASVDKKKTSCAIIEIRLLSQKHFECFFLATTIACCSSCSRRLKFCVHSVVAFV